MSPVQVRVMSLKGLSHPGLLHFGRAEGIWPSILYRICAWNQKTIIESVTCKTIALLFSQTQSLCEISDFFCVCRRDACTRLNLTDLFSSCRRVVCTFCFYHIFNLHEYKSNLYVSMSFWCNKCLKWPWAMSSWHCAQSPDHVVFTE